MRTFRLFVVLSLVAVSSASCRTWPSPAVDVHRFADAKKPPLRVVLFPPVCRESDGGCASIDLGGIAGRLQSELELAGYTVIDGAELVATARTRETAGAELRLFGEQVLQAGGIHQAGALFSDLPPAVRREVLTEAKADGILRTQVLVSAKQNFYGLRTLEVQGRLGLGVDETPAWSARCADIWVTGADYLGGPKRSYAEGAEVGARCVAHAALDG